MEIKTKNITIDIEYGVVLFKKPSGLVTITYEEEPCLVMRILRRFFNMSNICNRPVYQKGTKHKKKKENDREYLDWLKTQPSAVSGKTPCDPCHYRTARNSGIGCKPLWSAIPLTREEHLLQHQIGQYAFMPREWWEEKTSYYLSLFSALKQ